MFIAVLSEIAENSILRLILRLTLLALPVCLLVNNILYITAGYSSVRRINSLAAIHTVIGQIPGGAEKNVPNIRMRYSAEWSK